MTATWTSPNKSFNEQKQQQSMCVINICTSLSRPLQNKNEKWPSSAQSKEQEQPRLNFGISIWYWTLSLHVKSQHVFREFGKFIFDCVVLGVGRGHCLSSLLFKFMFNRITKYPTCWFSRKKKQAIWRLKQPGQSDHTLSSSSYHLPFFTICSVCV